MRAATLLRKCLAPVLEAMHALRERVLLQAVEALVVGRRLTLMDIARSWIGAERVRGPLKALDRLLSNRHLRAAREHIYAGMAQWLVRGEHPVIIIDWSELKANRSWHLLRAAVPVGGRTLAILDMVFPAGMQNSPKAEAMFLKRLRAVLPAGARPIVVTDAGFRAPWFRAVEAMGWYWVGRIRQRTMVRPLGASQAPDQWTRSEALYALATRTPHDLGVFDTARCRPWRCRLVVYAKPPRGRKQLTCRGQPARNTYSRKIAKRESEPWLLAVTLKLHDLSARQVVTLYARRMQIELSFRDLKSHQYGMGFEDSQSRLGHRLDMLLLLNALSAFATWLVGLAAEAAGLDDWLTPFRSKRRLYSLLRLGREALVRGWPVPRLSELIEHLRKPDDQLLNQLCVPA